MKTVLLSLAIALLLLPLVAAVGYALVIHDAYLIAQLIKGIQ